jgi:glycosyltransferase involved in cell wall biosynthesis
LEPDKGFDVAIEAFAKLRARGIDAELTLIGQGPERRFLGEVAIAHGVAEHVHLRGVLDHCSTLEAIANSSLVVIPSRVREGFSLVAVEAALFGVACVASRVGGLPEVVEDGVTGCLVAPGDAAALALAMTDLLGDVEGLRRLGANARERAEQKFDMNTCVDRYLELYRGLVR